MIARVNLLNQIRAEGLELTDTEFDELRTWQQPDRHGHRLLCVQLA